LVQQLGSIIGDEHPSVATSYNYIGSIWDSKGEYDKALGFYQKCLDIRLKTLGDEHPSVATSFFAIGSCNENLEAFDLAIDAYKMGYKVQKKGGSPFQIAHCYEKLNNLQEAYNYYLQSAEIRNSDPDCGPKNENTIDSIQNAVRIANLIGREIELPDWIKNHGK